jgi:Protein of unknown function (DUF3800)
MGAADERCAFCGHVADLVLSRGHRDGGIFMLVAYFDDSGTHDASEIVVMGGLIGTEAQWAVFERAWKDKLKEPLPGKPPLRRFHMHDCEGEHGEFAKYSRAERDAVTHDFRQIIIDAKMHGNATAVSRPDWDRLIVPPLLYLFGDAERWCFNACVSWAIKWAEHGSPDKLVRLVFDERPHRTKLHEAVAVMHQRFYNGDLPNLPKLVGAYFLRSELVVPLQAADMVAWETYRYALEHIRGGGEARPRAHLKARPRAHLKALIASGLLSAGLVDRNTAETMARSLGVQQA